MAQSSYLDIAKRKQDQRTNRIPEEWRLPVDFNRPDNVLDVPASCGILTPRELEITGQNDAVAIVRKIANRTYSAREVTVAFCKRAAIAQQLVNCLTEIFFDDAIRRAEQLDQEQAAKTGEPLRLLHGLPISLKDCFQIPGYDSTIGLIMHAESPDKESSALVKLLQDQGAIFYCKTNVPQTMMTADSENNVFGRTVNPYNPKLTAGGSSGGEGALIALRGSILGVGSDLAGSIRIPALANGVYGLKPTADIVPYAGQKDPAAPGTAGITPAAGPLATTLRACDLFMKAVADADPWKYDASALHRAPWKQLTPRQHRIRIGVFRDDSVLTPWPPVRRVLAEAVGRLTAAGFDIVELKMPDIREAIATTIKLYALDGGQFVQSTIAQGAEPHIKSLAVFWGTKAGPAATIQEYHALRHARATFDEFFKNFWLENGLDVILMPAASTTATPHDQWNGKSAYSALWNLLNYPALALPAGRVEENDKADGPENAIYGSVDQDYYKLYTGPADFMGVPLSIQLIGIHQEDERLVEIAEQIDEVIRHKTGV